MQTFLLGDGAKQSQQDTAKLLQEASDARAANNDLQAIIAYDMIAKIEIYKGNKPGAASALKESIAVANSESASDLRNVLLKNLDAAIGIAKVYYATTEAKRN
jgi:hypothetical protein